MDKEILKKETPYLVILLAIFIIDLIVGIYKIFYKEESMILFLSILALFIYASIMFYNLLKYQKPEYDNEPKVKKITTISVLTFAGLLGTMLLVSILGLETHVLGIIYLPLILIIGALIGLLVGLILSLNAIMKTNLKIVFITTIIFFILPTLDLIFINQGIEELSWISLFGFFLGTFIAIISKKGDYPKTGPVLGLLFASVPMIIDFLGITQVIRESIGYNLWILYLLPIIGLLIGYWIEKSIFKNKTN